MRYDPHTIALIGEVAAEAKTRQPAVVRELARAVARAIKVHKDSGGTATVYIHTKALAMNDDFRRAMAPVLSTWATYTGLYCAAWRLCYRHLPQQGYKGQVCSRVFGQLMDAALYAALGKHHIGTRASFLLPVAQQMAKLPDMLARRGTPEWAAPPTPVLAGLRLYRVGTAATHQVNFLRWMLRTGQLHAFDDETKLYLRDLAAQAQLLRFLAGQPDWQHWADIADQRSGHRFRLGTRDGVDWSKYLEAAKQQAQ